MLDLRVAELRAAAPMDGWFVVIGSERGGIPAFDETVQRADDVVVTLGIRSGKDLRTMRAGRFAYGARHARTVDRIVAQCAHWLYEDLGVNRGFQTLAPLEEKKCAGPPSRRERMLFFFAQIARVLEHGVRHCFEDVRWDVAVASTSVDRFVENPRSAWLHWVARDRREFLADPFVAPAAGGGARLLCEAFDGRTPTIVSIDLDDRHGERRALVAGEGPTSYPHVVNVDGELWLTPEQHRRRAVCAYRLNGSAREPVVILEGIAAVDPTIVHHEARWWLFCTDKESGVNDALRIYWALHPAGPWHAHAHNPAKIDAGGARPAGNFFRHDGRLYRPTQDCRGRYGRAIVIQRIDLLTPAEFLETPVRSIEVSSLRREGAIGVHTLSHGEGWVALDAQFARWSLRKPLRLLTGRYG